MGTLDSTLIVITAAGFCIIAFLLALFFIRYRPQKNINQLIEKIDRLDQRLEERTRISDRLLQETMNQLQTTLLEKTNQQSLQQQKDLNTFKEEIRKAFSEHRQSFDKRQLESLQALQISLQKGLQLSSDFIGQRVDKLTTQTEARLKDISGQVDKRLNEGFAKTTETFTDIIKRLALIDEAQKKITELSTNVVSLQEILSDKRARGAFGEVQLSSLLRNMLPENHFSLQHTLSNATRVDCMLFLPKPSGNVAIDAKFPLESYRNMTNTAATTQEKSVAERQFKQDIRKHLQDIASKYIIPGETADGAIMFLPAESVFAEIHSHYPDLIEIAQSLKVWLVSPTTLMAILTTARAVIKDEATQKQVNVIREHLRYLSQDFSRFQQRMDALAKHIHQAQQDVVQVNTSAKKISSRFEKIEQVELEQPEPVAIEQTEENSVSADA